MLKTNNLARLSPVDYRKTQLVQKWCDVILASECCSLCRLRTSLGDGTFYVAGVDFWECFDSIDSAMAAYMGCLAKKRSN